MSLIPLDDLDRQAREGWRLGAALCRGCGGYHQVWGLLRASGVVGGISVDDQILGPLLDETVQPGQRVLIAGAADAGLLQYLAASVRARPLKVRIVDRCPAPLALLARIAPPAGISLDLAQAELAQLDEPAAHDLILSHSMLYFISPSGRLQVLARLRDALAPGGRLALVLRLSKPVVAADAMDHDEAWLKRARARLAGHPDLTAMAGDDLEPVLAAYARARAVRLDAYSTPAEVEHVMARCGLALVQHIVSGASTTLRMGDTINRKQSHIFVARAV